MNPHGVLHVCPEERLFEMMIKPFLIVAIAWLVIGGGITLSSGAEILKFLALFSLCSMNLYFLYKTVDRLQYTMREKENQWIIAIQVFFWGFLKLSCLGAVFWSLYEFRAEEILPLLLGAGTLVWVPLVGGFWWSQQRIEGQGR